MTEEEEAKSFKAKMKGSSSMHKKKSEIRGQLDREIFRAMKDSNKR